MRPTILERERDLASIDDLVDAVLAGSGGALLLRAPAGMGKSTLLAESRERARATGLTVLSARGGELERAFAFGVVRQLLERPLRDAGPEARARWLAGPSSVAVALLEDRADAPAVEELALLHGLYWLASTVSTERPLLLVVDDAHWADGSSLRWLAFLARRLDGSRIGLLVASRPADPGADPALLDAVFAEMPTRDLEPLSAEAAGDVVRATLRSADDVFVGACHGASGGNPFLLAEVVSAARAAGMEGDADGARRVEALTSDELRRAVMSRIRAAGPSALELARAAAVLGDEALLRHAALLADIDEAVAVRAAEELVGLAVLRPGPRLAFGHALLRAAVLAELGELQARRDHARAAAILAEDGQTAERVAAHLLACDPVGETWTLDTLERAAAQAISRGSPRAAGRLFERALQEKPDVARAAVLTAALGGALVTSGDTRGLDAMWRARAMATDPVVRCAMAQRIALPSVMMGRSSDAADVLAEACAEAERDAPELVFAMRCQLANAVGASAGGEPLPDVIRSAIDVLPNDSERTLEVRIALAFLVNSLPMANVPAEQVSRLGLRALGTPAEHEEACEAGYPMPIVVSALALTETPVAVDEAFALMHAVTARRGAFALGSLFIHSYHAQCLHHRGDLAAAESAARTSLELRITDGFPMVGFMAVATLGAALTDRGETAAALALLDDELDRLAGHDAETLVDLIRVPRARALAALGRAGEAETLALEVGARCVARGTDAPATMPWRSVAAQAQIALGRPDDAAVLAAEELALAVVFGAPGPIGVARRVLGLARGDLGLLHDAEETLRGSTMRLAHAEALVDLGAAHRRAGARVQAREYLAAGLELAHRCGAHPLERRAHEELLAAGARTRSVVRTGVDALTASERRTAELAASGLTNRDIAQRLFVTPKTVETHLGAVYRKLGIAGRTELGVALGGPAPAP